jgi:hypothetical protein
MWGFRGRAILVGTACLVILSGCAGERATAETPALTVKAPESATPEPTPSPTLTPTPMPTLTATVTPIPRFFTESFEGEAPGWSHFLTSGRQGQLSLEPINGRLMADLKGTYLSTYVIYDGQTYDDVRLDIQMENVGRSQYGVAAVCRYEESKGWYEFLNYESAYGIAYVHLKTGTQLSWDFLGPQRYSQHWKPGEATNEFGMICQGSTFTALINGVAVQTVEDPEERLMEGKIGFRVYSTENYHGPASIAFDSVQISQP